MSQNRHQIPPMRNPPPPPPRGSIPPVRDKIPPPPPPPASRVIREGFQPPKPWPEPGKPESVDVPEPNKSIEEPGILRRILEYLKGSAEHLGTTKNLLREMTVGVGTAVLTYLVLHFAVPADKSIVGELRDVIGITVRAHQEADSLRFVLRTQALKTENDSLRKALYNRP